MVKNNFWPVSSCCPQLGSFFLRRFNSKSAMSNAAFRTVRVGHLMPNVEFDCRDRRLVIGGHNRFFYPFDTIVGVRFKDKRKQIKLAIRQLEQTIGQPQTLIILKLKFKSRKVYDSFYDQFEEAKLYARMGNCFANQNDDLTFLSPVFRCYLPAF